MNREEYISETIKDTRMLIDGIMRISEMAFREDVLPDDRVKREKLTSYCKIIGRHTGLILENLSQLEGKLLPD